MPNKYWIHIQKRSKWLWRSLILAMANYMAEKCGGSFPSLDSPIQETSRKSQSYIHNLELDALRTEMRSIKIQCYNTKKTRVSIVVVLEK